MGFRPFERSEDSLFSCLPPVTTISLPAYPSISRSSEKPDRTSLASFELSAVTLYSCARHMAATLRDATRRKLYFIFFMSIYILRLEYFETLLSGVFYLFEGLFIGYDIPDGRDSPCFPFLGQQIDEHHLDDRFRLCRQRADQRIADRPAVGEAGERIQSSQAHIWVLIVIQRFDQHIDHPLIGIGHIFGVADGLDPLARRLIVDHVEHRLPS